VGAGRSHHVNTDVRGSIAQLDGYKIAATAMKIEILPVDVPAAMGNVRTETLRAFNEDEYRRIIASIG
jgi:uncharacterized protein with GYD domain